MIIASPGLAHEEQVLACLAAGKYVLCEKPLTLSVESALRVVDGGGAGLGRWSRSASCAASTRRTPRLKSRLSSGELGRMLLLHNVHRNKSAPASFRSEMIVRDSLVHEVDMCRWLFDDEIATITRAGAGAVRSGPARGVQDPQVAMFRMASGGMATTEVFINSQVGYEVRCEAVGEREARSSPLRTPAAGRLPSRFAPAYDGRFRPGSPRACGDRSSVRAPRWTCGHRGQRGRRTVVAERRRPGRPVTFVRCAMD